MKIILKQIFLKVSILLMVCNPAYGAGSFYQSAANQQSAGHDFISGAQVGDVLIKINLWGAVHKPGIHRVPSKTDLLSLMSYAGGPKDNAILDEITIKRDVGKTRKLITVNLEELVKGASHHHIELAPNDVIVIPASKPLIGADTLAVIGVTSIILSTLFTAILIDRTTKK